MQGLNASPSPYNHVVLAAAAEDEQAALRLWRALKARRIDCSINDAHLFEGEATVLVAVVSEASADSLELTEQITAFRKSGGQAILAARRNGRAPLPPSLTALRGPTGLLEPAPAPIELGRLSDDTASARTIARAVARFVQLPLTVRARRNGGLIAVAAAATFMAGLSGWIHLDSRAQIEAMETRAQLAESLVTALAANFPSSSDGEALLSLAGQVEESLSQQRSAAISDEMLIQQARLLHSIGETYDLHGQPDRGQAAFSQAHAFTGEMLQRQPNNPDRIFAHSQSAFWAGNSAFRRGDLAAAETFSQSYAELAERLVALDPGNSAYQAEAGHAANNLGVIAYQRGELEQAATVFETALETFQGAPLAQGDIGRTDIANTRGWRANALYRLGRFEAAAAERRAEARIYRIAREREPENARLTGREATALYREGLALSAMGRLSEADNAVATALTLTEGLVRRHPDNIRYARQHLNAVRERARLAFWRDDLIRAQLLLNDARAFVDRVDRAGQQDERHIDRGLNHLLAAEIALAAGALETARMEAADAVLAGEHGLRSGFEIARNLLAYAYFVDAEARRLSGDTDSANRSFRETLGHLDALAGAAWNPKLNALRSRALLRLGEVEEARIVRAELDSSGYRRPDYLEFWTEADAALSADASEQVQGDDRG